MRNLFRRTRPDRGTVQVVDLPERHIPSYLVCLEDWSSEMREGRDHKVRWFEQARERGLRVKLAIDEDDRPVGMIQFVPIELSPVEGDGLYTILCIWVHGHAKGVGDAQGRGIGSQLLAAAEEDAIALGATGLAAWGLHIPVWMKASWFKKHGYVTADRVGMRELVWKPFIPGAQAPRWVEPQPVPVAAPGQVEVMAYLNGWCPAANLVYERSRRAVEELGSPVQFTTIDTSERDAFVRCGHVDEVFVNGRVVQRGAPPSYRAIRRKIERQVRRHSRQR